MRLPELLAPAGNLEKLKIAIHYGADAVYLGGQDFGLRQLADNFTFAEMAEAVETCHRHGVKAYLTVNSYLHDADIKRLPLFLSQIRNIPFDAYIVADPGVFETVREEVPDMEVHLSTQANTVNGMSARFWQRQGVRRINLARELSAEEIKAISARVNMEFEVFVHGAMCISYSGRCLLSNMMSGRNANQGACSHPCRWNYSLVEETRPGEYFPVFEDKNGTFIFNSKDLCLLPHLPVLLESNVAALKIEGRMKGIHYLASVVRVYREALDRYAADPERYRYQPEWLEELQKISHRGYTTGFFFGTPGDADHEYHSRYLRSHDFVGVVEDVRPDGTAVIGVRNRLATGERVEIIGRGMRSHSLDLPEMVLPATDTEPATVIPVAHANTRILIKMEASVERYDLIRRQKPDGKGGATSHGIPPETTGATTPAALSSGFPGGAK